MGRRLTDGEVSEILEALTPKEQIDRIEELTTFCDECEKQNSEAGIRCVGVRCAVTSELIKLVEDEKE